MTRPTKGSEIRSAFLRFFEEKDHLIVPAASLIPTADPTLLLTNSGMAQFKAYFSGETKPPHPRIATAQKCFRTTDIESVGDATHLTLFEMLGNFSFADYFKKEACAWGLELMADALEFPVERLYFTVHHEDREAEQIWLDLGIPRERIFHCGDEDNWWGPAGDEGPCGPCSEIYYYSGDLAAVPAQDDPRRGTTWGPNSSPEFVELYNLVFTQFYHHLDGTRTELPGKNIDTGMGLERTAAAIQHKPTVYETDLFAPLIHRTEQMAGVRYGDSPNVDRAIRVVAEHGRSASFLIGDGVVPGNTGRGYVLRRLIRRGMRFGHELGLKSPFLPQIAEVAAQEFGEAYPALVDNLAFIQRVLETEETKFSDALRFGTRVLESMIAFRSQVDANAAASRSELQDKESLARDLEKSGIVPGSGDSPDDIGERAARDALVEALSDGGQSSDAAEQWRSRVTGGEAFLLYATYGFPIEFTREVVQDHELQLDEEGFQAEIARQREQSRAASSQFGGDTAQKRVYEQLGVDHTQFLGYATQTATHAESIIVGLIRDGEPVEQARAGEDVQVVLRETPFFAERGGQVGDSGMIRGEHGSIEVNDTQNPYAHINVHFGRVADGVVNVGDFVEADVDAERRQRIMRNHTGTHLVHAALRQVLGTHVRQAGSLVAPERLRFDFTHIAPLSREELLEVQRVVNDRIRANHDVHVEWTTYRDAVDRGALAFFGEKYDENEVRTILIDAPWSYELCGGTHCRRTGDIGAFVILSDQSIGAGMRRIEALTGKGAEEGISERFEVLDRLTQELQAPLDELPARVETLRSETDRARRKIAELEAAVLRASVAGGAETASPAESLDVGGETVQLQVRRVDAPNVDALRKTGDFLRDKLGSGIVVLGSVIDGRPMVVSMVTKDLVAKGFHAGRIAKEVASRMGGGGGGRPETAQAGGRDAGKLDEALAAVGDIVRGAVAAGSGSGRATGGSGAS